jgi:hypothetical protein
MVDRITAPSRILLHLIPGVPREFARSKLNREEDIPGARKPFPGFTLFGAAALFLESVLLGSRLSLSSAANIKEQISPDPPLNVKSEEATATAPREVSAQPRIIWPRAIALCADVSDVITAVRFARAFCPPNAPLLYTGRLASLDRNS